MVLKRVWAGFFSGFFYFSLGVFGAYTGFWIFTAMVNPIDQHYQCKVVNTMNKPLHLDCNAGNVTLEIELPSAVPYIEDEWGI